MKKRYELQFNNIFNRWVKSIRDKDAKSLKSKIEQATIKNERSVYEYRVVQKLGRKVIKVIYPKGKK